ncbi:MAG: aspartyl protease family protein [Deltaproteobacteria bacterium]|jgi:predicted aspartyl protease|nr:aspartyl protease family protein [Deltaproteobacteria bacterium]
MRHHLLLDNLVKPLRLQNILVSCVLTLIICAHQLWVGPQMAHALIYKYVDETGRMVYVDDIDKVPLRYQQEVQTILEEQDALTQEQLDTRQAERVRSFEEQQIRKRTVQAEAYQAMRRAYQTPISFRGNRVVVPVEVAMGNRIANLLLLLDTGASRTVLHRQALSGLELPSGEKIEARIAGGQALASEKIKFKHIGVGPFRKTNAFAMVIETQGPPLPFDGMLGMDFLKDHPYRVDYDNNLLLWDVPEPNR